MNSCRATVYLLRNCPPRGCSTRLLSRSARSASISKDAVVEKSFSKTLLLPKTSFPLWADPSKGEVPFQKRTCEDLYRDQWKNRQNAPLFVLHDGPPYANGNLHMDTPSIKFLRI